ncbi:type IV secretion system protein [Pantoea ananatis]|uniref:type IV secretion system protein n=1 Tax=Pantoea ananas TaxID=553 RepID=UPI001B30F5AD|nr:type IV secretion system protein [Pantoea ananatis]
MQRNKFRFTLISFLLGIASGAHAGIPVALDADPMRDIQWAKEAQDWIKTAEFYKDSMQNYQQQLASQTGLRDVVGLVNQAKGLKNDIMDLQKQGISLNDLLSSGNAPSGALDSLYSKYKDFDVCGVQSVAAYATACKQETINKAWMIEQTNDVQETVSSTLDDISSLTDRVANAKDAKESQDLANSINLKSIQLNTITNQWEMNMKAADQRAKLLEEKRKKAFHDQQYNAPVPTYSY